MSARSQETLEDFIYIQDCFSPNYTSSKSMKKEKEEEERKKERKNRIKPYRRLSIMSVAGHVNLGKILDVVRDLKPRTEQK